MAGLGRGLSLQLQAVPADGPGQLRPHDSETRAGRGLATLMGARAQLGGLPHGGGGHSQGPAHDICHLGGGGHEIITPWMGVTPPCPPCMGGGGQGVKPSSPLHPPQCNHAPCRWGQRPGVRLGDRLGDRRFFFLFIFKNQKIPPPPPIIIINPLNKMYSDQPSAATRRPTEQRTWGWGHQGQPRGGGGGGGERVSGLGWRVQARLGESGGFGRRGVWTRVVGSGPGCDGLKERRGAGVLAMAWRLHGQARVGCVSRLSLGVGITAVCGVGFRPGQGIRGGGGEIWEL